MATFEEYIKDEVETIERHCKRRNITPVSWIKKYSKIFRKKWELSHGCYCIESGGSSCSVTQK